MADATQFDAFANILTPEVLNALRAQKRAQVAAGDANLSGRARGDVATGRAIGGLVNRFIGPGRKQAKDARQNQATLDAAQETIADREANENVDFGDTLSRQEAVIEEAIKIARDSGNFDLANDLLTSAAAVDERRARLSLLQSETTLNLAKARAELVGDPSDNLAEQKFINALTVAAEKSEADLKNVLDTETTNVRTSLESVGTINSILESAGGDYLQKTGGGPDGSFAVVDAALVRAWMLMLEPNSVVRETEFQTMADAREAIENGSVTAETARRVGQFTSGDILRPGQRRAMLGLVRAEQGRLEDRVAQSVADTRKVIQSRNQRIQASGLPSERFIDEAAVLGDFLINIADTTQIPDAADTEPKGPPSPTRSGDRERIRIRVN